MNVNEFEKTVTENLKKAVGELTNLRIGAAVSGGADSISLLESLYSISTDNKFKLFCITVNHNLREENETKGDADFVIQFCKKKNIDCTLIEIERGKIKALAKEKKCGLEDAARILRYEAFYSFINKYSLDYLCLAHNSNDQNETVLMRILQGSSNSLSGIPFTREKFVRPLLSVSRNQIENYLKQKNISFRTDSTNFENSMLRNKIRNVLIPFLNENFDGWKKSLDSLAKKSSIDSEFINTIVQDNFDKILIQKMQDKILLKKNNFAELHLSIKTRIIYKAIEIIGADKRIPYSNILQFCTTLLMNQCGGIIFDSTKDEIIIRKIKPVATESGFFAIIEEPCQIEFFSHKITIQKNDLMEIKWDEKNIQLRSLNFPFILRSRISGDKIKCSNGSFRNISKILDDWKCQNKNDIPVIEDWTNNSIACLWGETFGFKNWISQDYL